ncbi:hypothetical protein Bca101_015714 [Brassica carinata]
MGHERLFEAHLPTYPTAELVLCVFEEGVTLVLHSPHAGFVELLTVCLSGTWLSSTRRRRSRNPMARKIASDRFTYRDDPYRRDSHRTFRHNLSECSTKSVCWNCREPGHMSNTCTKEGICHSCGIAGHQAKDCTGRHLPPGDLRLCNNCYKQGHFAADCTNEKACNNCRKTGHLARDCRDDPVCNHCNLSGHLAIKCPKTHVLAQERRPRGIRAQIREEEEVVCRNCRQVGHMSRDCRARLMICRNCGGRGHIAYECPSERLVNHHHHYPSRPDPSG